LQSLHNSSHTWPTYEGLISNPVLTFDPKASGLR